MSRLMSSNLSMCTRGSRGHRAQHHLHASIFFTLTFPHTMYPGQMQQQQYGAMQQQQYGAVPAHVAGRQMYANAIGGGQMGMMAQPGMMAQQPGMMAPGMATAGDRNGDGIPDAYQPGMAQPGMMAAQPGMPVMILSR